LDSLFSIDNYDLSKDYILDILSHRSEIDYCFLKFDLIKDDFIMEVKKQLDYFEQVINWQNFMELVIHLDCEYLDFECAKFKESTKKVKNYFAARVGAE
jgi:hypothetical protein